jgi:hypothetical protein
MRIGEMLKREREMRHLPSWRRAAKARREPLPFADPQCAANYGGLPGLHGGGPVLPSRSPG